MLITDDLVGRRLNSSPLLHPSTRTSTESKENASLRLCFRTASSQSRKVVFDFRQMHLKSDAAAVLVASIGRIPSLEKV